MFFCFSKPQSSGNVKRAPSVYLCWWQRFPSTPRDASHLFCSTQVFCSLARRNWKLCKISDNSFLKLFLWTRKTKFWHLSENFYPGGRSFFVLCPNMLKEKHFLYKKFFSNGSSRQVESSFVKNAEKNCANGQVFFAQFPHLRKISFFQWKTVSLKCPLGQVDKYFDNPLD